MGAIDRLFGLVVLLAGFAIAIYYSLWVVLTIVRMMCTKCDKAICSERVEV